MIIVLGHQPEDAERIGQVNAPKLSGVGERQFEVAGVKLREERSGGHRG